MTDPHGRSVYYMVQDLAKRVNELLTDRLAAAESKIVRLLQATKTEPPRPYLVRGCVGGTEHDWHTVERGATFWCPECDAERPARA